MSDVVLCSIAGCYIRFKRAGKHPMCLAHSPCYVSGQYDPFGGPCLLCVNWLRGLANPLTPLEDRLGCIVSLKDWLRWIIRCNKEHKINVNACSDPLMLEIFKSRKGILPET